MLNDIVYKYNSTVHRSIKMKPIDVTSDSYAEYNEDSNEKDPQFKVGDHVRISKYKNIFAKWYTQNGQKKFLLLVKLKIHILGLTLLVPWMVNQLLEVFYEKELQKTSQEKFRIGEVLKKRVINYT